VQVTGECGLPSNIHIVFDKRSRLVAVAVATADEEVDVVAVAAAALCAFNEWREVGDANADAVAVALRLVMFSFFKYGHVFLN
jgi:hypothetical protein